MRGRDLLKVTQPSNLQGSDSKAVSVICLFVQFSDLGVGLEGSQMEGFEMCGQEEGSSPSFVLLSPSAQDSVRSLLKAILDPSLTQDPHTYPHFLTLALLSFVSLHAVDHCLHCETYFSVDFPAPTSSLSSGSLPCSPSQLQPSNQCLGSWPWLNPAKVLLCH